MTLENAPFGNLADGREVRLITLTSPNGTRLRFMTLGMIVTRLDVPDRNGRPGNVVLGFDNLPRYLQGHPFFGAIAGFVVQCGDPTATGTGNPGYKFDDELGSIEPYRIGSVAMANSGPNTNGSQFFIISGDDGALLPPNYTLFGQVIDDDLGMVATLDALGNPQDGPPLEPIDIISVTITEK